LILTRKLNQNIVIYDPKSDNTYEIVVTEIRGDSVRIGIVAPRSVAVDRAEIAHKSEAKALHPDKVTV
jgi:carbon storage regulator CsrA